MDDHGRPPGARRGSWKRRASEVAGRLGLRAAETAAGGAYGDDYESILDGVESLRRGYGRALLLFFYSSPNFAMADTASIASHTSRSSGSTARSTDRSVSRGREFYSSGRGGVGNIRRASKDDLTRPPASPSSPTGRPDHDDLSLTRGREPPAINPDSAKSTGRGGAGNIRSTSIARAANHLSGDGQHSFTASLVTDQAEAAAEYERRVVAARQEASRNARRTYGRGGAGNAAGTNPKSPKTSKSRSGSRFRSRSRSASVAPVHSSGRGGAGNLYPGSPEDAERIGALDDVEMGRARATSPEGRHSTGRGGLANITAMSSPPPDSPSSPLSPHHAESTGRGGVGNIFRSRSRSASKDRSSQSEGLKKIWKKVSRSRSRAPGVSPARNEDDGVVDLDIRGARGIERASMESGIGSVHSGGELSAISSRSGEQTLHGSTGGGGHEHREGEGGGDGGERRE
ncbi:uncharacterized protein C8Q71DRAFT_379960 [Rhodofomes roseus]|uniref:Uncharacterized protein n=1 Tax=Rhodofomes roseus TaxID=34475 RepID=A0ABQ8K141_9APHY|nr:uncharacterized protein C8Q71DRAFT_379960 [Rhodofomes roseus]KAH9830143.1 hypothetical protein C8Q71DRAFT_379960 [Rhodofomes roseus]